MSVGQFKQSVGNQQQVICSQADLVSVTLVHFTQPAVDLLLDVHDVQPHLLLCGFQLTLQFLEQGFTVATNGWCLKRMVTIHKYPNNELSFIAYVLDYNFCPSLAKTLERNIILLDLHSLTGASPQVQHCGSGFHHLLTWLFLSLQCP